MSFPLLALFGGTFDPIHNGHLSVAEGLFKSLPFENIQLIPSRNPPNGKQPKVSLKERIAMIKLAIADKPFLKLNTMEIEREGISYTIDTLKSCQQIFRNKSLCLILATDVFSHLNEWHEWENILKYCHIIIAERPQFSLPKEKWDSELLKKHKTENAKDLHHLPTGKILLLKTTSSRITATEIRQNLAKEDYQAVATMLPKPVLDHIQKHELYREKKIWS